MGALDCHPDDGNHPGGKPMGVFFGSFKNGITGERRPTQSVDGTILWARVLG